MGETALRGMYHVLASSLLVIICFVKNDLPDREINLWQPLSTKGLAKRSSFFFELAVLAQVDECYAAGHFGSIANQARSQFNRSACNK